MASSSSLLSLPPFKNVYRWGIGTKVNTMSGLISKLQKIPLHDDTMLEARKRCMQQLWLFCARYPPANCPYENDGRKDGLAAEWSKREFNNNLMYKDEKDEDQHVNGALFYIDFNKPTKKQQDTLIPEMFSAEGFQQIRDECAKSLGIEPDSKPSSAEEQKVAESDKIDDENNTLIEMASQTVESTSSVIKKVATVARGYTPGLSKEMKQWMQNITNIAASSIPAVITSVKEKITDSLAATQNKTQTKKSIDSLAQPDDHTRIAREDAALLSLTASMSDQPSFSEQETIEEDEIKTILQASEEKLSKETDWWILDETIAEASQHQDNEVKKKATEILMKCFSRLVLQLEFIEQKLEENSLSLNELQLFKITLMSRQTQFDKFYHALKEDRKNDFVGTKKRIDLLLKKLEDHRIVLLAISAAKDAEQKALETEKQLENNDTTVDKTLPDIVGPIGLAVQALEHMDPLFDQHEKQLKEFAQRILLKNYVLLFQWSRLVLSTAVVHAKAFQKSLSGLVDSKQPNKKQIDLISSKLIRIGDSLRTLTEASGLIENGLNYLNAIILSRGLFDEQTKQKQGKIEKKFANTRGFLVKITNHCNDGLKRIEEQSKAQGGDKGKKKGLKTILFETETNLDKEIAGLLNGKPAVKYDTAADALLEQFEQEDPETKKLEKRFEAVDEIMHNVMESEEIEEAPSHSMNDDGLAEDGMQTLFDKMPQPKEININILNKKMSGFNTEDNIGLYVLLKAISELNNKSNSIDELLSN